MQLVEKSIKMKGLLKILSSHTKFLDRITLDNFFTSLPLAEHLLSWNLTIVYTLKRNESYVHQEIKAMSTKKCHHVTM